MKKRVGSLLAVLVAAAGFALMGPAPVRGDSCPADEHDGVRVQGCQIGDDIQVLAHNYTTNDVSVDVNVTYREKTGALRSRSFHANVSAGGGGEIGMIEVRPYRTLSEVADVTLKAVTPR